MVQRSDTQPFKAVVTKELVSLVSKDDESRVLQKLPIVAATEDHRNYILSTWVKSYEGASRKLFISPWPTGFGRLTAEIYRAGESIKAETWWDSAKVVVSEDDNFTIHGWISAAEGSLNHVYVPPHLRGCGLGKGLVEAFLGKEYMVYKPAPFKSHNQIWNPYL